MAEVSNDTMEDSLLLSEAEDTNDTIISLASTSNTSVSSTNSMSISFSNSSILDGTFFSVVPEKSSVNYIVAVCKKCKPKDVEVKGRLNSTSNFRSHLKRRHGDAVLHEYMEYVQTKKLSRSAQRKSNHQRSTVTQESFNQHLANYVVHSMAPLRTVEDLHFLKLFEHLNISGIHVYYLLNFENQIILITNTFISISMISY